MEVIIEQAPSIGVQTSSLLPGVANSKLLYATQQASDGAGGMSWPVLALIFVFVLQTYIPLLNRDSDKNCGNFFFFNMVYDFLLGPGVENHLSMQGTRV